MQKGQKKFVLILLSCILTLIVFYGVLDFGWLNYDDPALVQQNELVKELNLNSVKRIFTEDEIVGAYTPITIISFALDHQIWENDPFGYHLGNLLLHLINTVLVFLFVFRLSRDLIVSTISTLLFAIHPMHAESVAWISARKDLLSGLFYIGGMLAYLHYLDKEKRRIFLLFLVYALAILAMLAKPMAVSFPIALIIIEVFRKKHFHFKYLIDKSLLFIIALLIGIFAVPAQQKAGAMLDVSQFEFHKTIFFGSYNLLIYLAKFLIPYGLSPFHPYPFDHVDDMSWFLYFSGVLVLLLSLALFIFRSKIPQWVFLSLLLFLVMILPVLQILPFSNTLYAERFTYLPYIGLAILFGSIVSSMMERSKLIRLTALIICVLIIGTFTIITHSYKNNWLNSNVMWSAALEQYPDDITALNNRADHLISIANYELAETDLNKSIELRVNNPKAFYLRGILNDKIGNYRESYNDYSRSIELDSTDTKTYLNRAIIAGRDFNDFKQAILDLNRAIEINPEYHKAWINRGVIQEQLINYRKAQSDYESALKLAPNQPVYHKYLGSVMLLQQDHDNAITSFTSAIQLNPDYAEAYYLRSIAYSKLMNVENALKDGIKARELGYVIRPGETGCRK